MNNQKTEFYIENDPYPRCWLDRYVQERISELLELEKDWDSYDADPINPKAVRAVSSIVAQLGVDQTITPFVVPLCDGGIQLEWHTLDTDIEIEVDSKGDAHLLIMDETGKIDINVEMELDDIGFAVARKALSQLEMA